MSAGIEIEPPRRSLPVMVAAAAQPIRRFFRTPKGLLLVVLPLLAAVAATNEGLRLALPEVIGAALAAALLDVAMARIIRGAWFFPSGALLSGLIVAMIVSPTEPRRVAVITAMLAVNSKYLFRARGGHIFNPAALALVAAYFLFASEQSWWGALSNVPLPFVVVLISTGIFIADRVNKLPMVLAFLGCYLSLFTLATFIGHAGQATEIFRAPDINAALFFAFDFFLIFGLRTTSFINACAPALPIISLVFLLEVAGH